MSEANKATVQRFVNELFMKGNMDVVDELISDDYVDHTPPPGLPSGKSGLKQLATMFRTGFPDMAIGEEDLIAEGDKVVMRQVTIGTHKGEFMGIAATGRKVTINEIHVVRLTNGKIVEHWGVEDNLGMMQQLGVAESP